MEIDNLESKLIAYIQGGRVHPASLLKGPRTEGRWKLAKNIAKQLLCPSVAADPRRRYCDQCNTCRRVELEIHPDFLTLQEPEEDQIKIDAIRDLSHQMSLSPMEARAKVCVIDECHRMNHASANAFLKTLEEPGEGRYFWLLSSNPSSLPETVLSRCVKFTIRPTKEEENGMAPEVAANFETMLSEVITSKSPSSAVAALSSKEKTLAFVQYLQVQLRNAALEPNASPSPFTKIRWSDAQQKFADALTLEGRLRSNANYGLMLESFLRTSLLGGTR